MTGAMMTENPFRMTMYVMDVLEELGDDIAHRVYWDFGRWSDLHRRWKAVPESITLADVLFSQMDGKYSAIRLSRCLSEIAIEAYLLCSSAFEQAYINITRKMHHVARMDGSGRTSSSFSDASDAISMDLIRNYCCFASGCLPFKNKGTLLHFTSHSFSWTALVG